MIMLHDHYNEHDIIDLINHLLFDGVLKTAAVFLILLAKPAIVRLKIMAKLNIAEQRLPQDGLLTIKDQTMRVSSLPILHGKKIILRVMDNHQSWLTMEQLGLTVEELNQYRQVLNAPQGLILVTGPTGSGKTLTLCSSLKEINQDTRNICSVEDPIEISIEGINQTQINSKAGVSFGQILRSLLRQDPDIMMIGEIRDYETAEIAIQAAQTGHLVLSTLHTNSSAEAIIRLNQMGIQNYLLTSSLKLIIAQRLVRKLCHHCKVIVNNSPYVEKNSLDHDVCHFITKGCKQCIGVYYGRTGLYEMLFITPQLQSQLFADNHCSLDKIHYLLQQNKIKTLHTSGQLLVERGITSLEEIKRVLGS